MKPKFQTATEVGGNWVFWGIFIFCYLIIHARCFCGFDKLLYIQTDSLTISLTVATAALGGAIIE
ncbi:uncharacterized protein BCR38DRAFT_432214 [Pseudomassariella vexata]|uniref:Uncharacterized protein n=1 Tax=Pseudomassariella vexata TaxID=1141098 RepID=A0A1Y2E140_9PEZI|nr:uncharacterized protein BCR38DRAFT_432214 [Pseudomassariella vexata]ORY65250.1 hypothetical protein BCR38DRAFT_432214 [Pseudomassariella vexata]